MQDSQLGNALTMCRSWEGAGNSQLSQRDPLKNQKASYTKSVSSRKRRGSVSRLYPVWKDRSGGFPLLLTSHLLPTWARVKFTTHV